jgi:hypothetical protein
VSRACIGRRRIAALGCALWLPVALWLPAASAQEAAAEPAPAPFVVGIGRSIHDPEAATAAMAELGVQSVRLDAPWKSIETAPGRYAIPAWLDAAVDDANARGIEPLLILAYGHPAYGDDKPRNVAAITAFARYAVFVTEHFQGRVRYFDVWNEWDAHTGKTTPGTPDDYVALARRVYPAIKSANAGAVVLSGGIATLRPEDGWIDRFIALGGLQFVDGLSLHPYNFQQPSAREQPRANTPEAAIATLERVHSLSVAAGRPVPIYVTEIGYPTYDGRGGVSRDVAAAYLARFMLLASTRPYIAGTWWYCLRDQGGDPKNKEHNFGVLDSKLERKAAADALRAVASLMTEVQRFRVDGTDADADQDRDGAERRVLATRADGSELAFAWNANETDTRLLGELQAAAAADAHAVSPRARR